MSSAVPTVMASARKNVPVTPVIVISGMKTTIGRNGRSDQRNGDLAQRAANRFAAALSGIAMQHDILDDHDGVVDDETDGGGETAERHQVEAFAEEAQDDERDGDGGGDDQSGHERTAPVAQEQHQDDGGQNQTDDDGIAHAPDGIRDNFRLVVVSR